MTRATKTCGNNGKTGVYWRVTIGRNLGNIPTRVKRKRPDPKRKTQRDHLMFGIRKVECLGEGDYFGFVLDGDSRFLGDDFTVLHNTGKTNSFGRIALWHLLCFPYAIYDGKLEIGSNTYIGAPRIQQVADGVWKEMQDAKIAMASGPFAWICQHFEINKTRVTVKGFEDQWFIAQVALQKGASVGIAGKHRYWQLVIVDEAAGVSDDHFNVIDGTQTQAGNRTLMASQGVRNSGRFYDSHHNLAIDNGGSWTPLRFNSERSPFVTSKWLKDRENECGGRHSVEYRVRVLGQFADNTGANLLARVEIDKAFERRAQPLIRDDELFGYVLLGDVGMGEYRDDSVLTIAKITGNADMGEDARRVEYIQIPICRNDLGEIEFAGEIVNIFGRQNNPVLLVDNGGIGAAVATLIERSGVPVTRIDWGKPCFKREYKDRFYNQRACANVRLRDAIRDGRVLLPQGLDKKLKEKILMQGSRLPYHFAEAGGLKYVMAKKEKMREDGIKSPDIWDTFAFAFLEDCIYIPAAKDGALANKGAKAAAVDDLQSMLDDALSA